ncbi:anti sigma factor C-terminal domain-containing protein [Cytobacillus horneckiae]|uniref:anti sigma factor C-terminal domain-containing protein n=1 Tax=Cytobacillus horneckiae TaxID=549687 RepID=UPI00203EE3E0|nr:anti sigma factor C-terminal domain-containing protein [Cytobacillus horneckiae]MCM3178010.1 anti-sigma factor [Cytobacillus horneckiae]
MSNNDKKHESEENNKELDFVTNPSMQKVIKKAKWKQTMKILIISLLTTCILLFGIFTAGQYLLQKRLVNDDKSLFSQINGANVYTGSEMHVYGFLNLSAVKHITVNKTIGDREIVWNKQEIEIPFIGRKSMIDNERFTESTEFSERLNRQVHYNSFTGEREVDFYYPQLEYEYLPNELEIATKLDDNTIAEVALSFDKPYKLKEIQNLMGSENVNWVWVKTTTKDELDDIKSDSSLRIMDGPSADGFHVGGDDINPAAETFLRILKQLSKEGKYQTAVKEMTEGINPKSFPMVDDLRISGIVVSGTPNELEKFQDLEIIRASTIGATIDIY